MSGATGTHLPGLEQVSNHNASREQPIEFAPLGRLGTIGEKPATKA